MSSILLPNVPLLHLPHSRKSKSWSFIGNHKASEYYTSRAYFIDALNVSFRIPPTCQQSQSCSCSARLNEEVNFQNMRHLLFGKQTNLTLPNHCTKQSIRLTRPKKLKSRRSSPSKTPPRPIDRSPINCKRSQQTRPSSPPKLSNPIDASPLNIISRTRFGQSLCALYFQKYRFISPMNTIKKDQFLRLVVLR